MVPREINNAEDLLTELSAQADILGLPYSSNSNALGEPVDALDAAIEHYDPEQGERQLQHDTPVINIEHEEFESDDQPDDPEEIEMAWDTLAFFLEAEKHAKQNFEREFRAFLHCGDYSYSAKTVRKLVAAVLENYGR